MTPETMDDGKNTVAEEPASETITDPRPVLAPPTPPAPPAVMPSLMRLPWLGAALVIVTVVGAIAKVLGVLIVPGMVGVSPQRAVEIADLFSSTFAYAFALLAIALIGAGAFELSRIRGIGMVSRGVAIGMSGLAVAFAVPSLIHRLHAVPTMGLCVATIIVTVIGAANALRSGPTRILGVVLLLFAVAALVRPASWALTLIASDQQPGLYGAGQILAAIALVFSALATLLAAAWLGTRSPVRGRLLANGAIVLAFLMTYLAARESTSPGTLQLVLHSSLAQADGLPLPFALTSIGAFLVPATILLALVSVAQRAAAPAVLASLALALLSQGALDVPLQALAMAAAGQWAMLAMADPKSVWAAMTAGRPSAKKPQRFGV